LASIGASSGGRLDKENGLFYNAKYMAGLNKEHNYALNRELWRHVIMPIDLYCYIKAVGIVTETPQWQVISDFVSLHREALESRVALDARERAAIKAAGGVWRDGELFVPLGETASDWEAIGGEGYLPVDQYRARVEEEYQKALRGVELSAKIARDRAIKADKARRQQAAAAVAAPHCSAAVVGVSKGGSR